jgi:hypothetical protein
MFTWVFTMNKTALAPYDLRKQWAEEAGELPDNVDIARVDGGCICETCGKEYRCHPDDWRTAHDGNDYFPWLVVMCDGTLGKL